MTTIYKFENVLMTDFMVSNPALKKRTNRGKRVIRIMGECIKAGGSVDMEVVLDMKGREVASGTFDWRQQVTGERT